MRALIAYPVGRRWHPTVYGCDGYEDDPDNEGSIRRAPGYEFTWDHFRASEWTQYRVGDSDVLALLARLEAAEVAWQPIETAPTTRGVWLAWNKEDPTHGEARFIDGRWLAAGTFYDAKRKPPYRFGETIVTNAFAWRELPCQWTETKTHD